MIDKDKIKVGLEIVVSGKVFNEIFGYPATYEPTTKYIFKITKVGKTGRCTLKLKHFSFKAWDYELAKMDGISGKEASDAL